MKTFFFFFFLESTCALCPWSLALASSIPVLGLENVCPRKGCPWPWPWPRIFFVSLALALASSLVSSTPPLALTKLRWENLWKLRSAIISRPMRLQLITCHKKELLSSLCSIKLELIRNKCFQCKPVCTGTMNEWCKILTIKTLTEVNRT